MSNSNARIVNGVEIDEAKAKELLRWLILTETNNAKTKEKSDQQMITTIQKKIEEVVKCY
ncbi:hypothetical protein X793_03850 [Dehalococcoides mccartyi CG4]|uniref:hypothetical protein n=1 Tax=Dehalococcoides mccartyi TaxID=61435 RepID=UPI0004E05630|nr:hypothetical protein [Dehalococcoides mccartyi]AII60201.1 hypothetical protein X793_03850 [Dehalococcoides mccartyi CG4]